MARTDGETPFEALVDEILPTCRQVRSPAEYHFDPSRLLLHDTVIHAFPDHRREHLLSRCGQLRGTGGPWRYATRSYFPDLLDWAGIPDYLQARLQLAVHNDADDRRLISRAVLADKQRYCVYLPTELYRYAWAVPMALAHRAAMFHLVINGRLRLGATGARTASRGSEAQPELEPMLTATEAVLVDVAAIALGFGSLMSLGALEHRRRKAGDGLGGPLPYATLTQLSPEQITHIFHVVNQQLGVPQSAFPDGF